MDITPVTSRTLSDTEKQKIQKVAQDFEALFSSMVLKSMRQTVGDNPLMPQSFGEKIYTDMLDDEYSKVMSKNGSFGLAGLVAKELERQELNSQQPEVPNDSVNKLYMLDNSFVPQKSSQNNSPSASDTVSSNVSKWDDLISEASETYNVDKNLIYAVIAQESGGNQYAVSKAGAKGLMQLMDSTATSLGVRNSFSPRLNIMGGTKYLSTLLDKYNGNEKLALASYNAGPAAVDKYNGIPPYTETQDYVESVLSYKSKFANNQKEQL